VFKALDKRDGKIVAIKVLEVSTLAWPPVLAL
jgi:hypothetical protein